MFVIDADVDDDEMIKQSQQELDRLVALHKIDQTKTPVDKYVLFLKQQISLHGITIDTAKILSVPVEQTPLQHKKMREATAQKFGDFYKAVQKHQTEKIPPSEQLEILCVLHEFKCPTFILYPLRDSVFQHLNEKPEDERRAFIGMPDDKYDAHTEIVRTIAFAQTEQLIPYATGTFYVAAPDKPTTSGFAWPSEFPDKAEEEK